MATYLLPSDFDQQIASAVEFFWQAKGAGTGAQEGKRTSVVSGKNLDGFLAVARSVAAHCGIPESSVHTSGKKFLTLPGFYRPIKNWDVVVVHNYRLLAAIEFKSQAGSFGNNFNNRCEEALGNVTDLRAAYEKGLYHPERHKAAGLNSDLPDPRSPFLGYLMLLEDCEGSTNTVKTDSPHYVLDPQFDGSSYADRYKIFCERLMSRRLYESASLILSPSSRSESGEWRALSDATDPKELFASFAAQLLSAQA